MATEAQYIKQARKWFHEDGVFEIERDAQVDFEYEIDEETGNLIQKKEIGAFVHCRVWLLEDDGEPG